MESIPFKNNRTQFGWVAIALHWVMALAIFAMFALGFWMVELNYYDSWYHDAPYIHKAIGMLLLFLLAFRIVWVLANVKPDILGLAWERMIALIVHRTHYVLMLALMVTGYLIPTANSVGIDVFGWFTVPASLSFTKEEADIVGKIHWAAAWAMMGLAALHTGAALKHHFIDRDATLLRMLGLNHHEGTKAQRR